jgi:uncharacterized membrane protein YoaK (UPF0700 family)
MGNSLVGVLTPNSRFGRPNLVVRPSRGPAFVAVGRLVARSILTSPTLEQESSSMSTSAPVLALMLAAAFVLAIGFVAGSFPMMVLSIVSFFGAGLLTVLDGKRS